MALNLIKLCVGADSVRDLEDWIKQKLKDKRKRGEKPEHIHRTRMVPKRADELTDGGSLYWVIRGEIMCRQRIRAIRPFRDKDGIGRCGVVLDPKVVLVAPRPYPRLPGLALPRREGRTARPRQSGAGRSGDARKAAPRAARTRLDVSSVGIGPAPVVAWRSREQSRKVRGTKYGRCGARHDHRKRKRRHQGGAERACARQKSAACARSCRPSCVTCTSSPAR